MSGFVYREEKKILKNEPRLFISNLPMEKAKPLMRKAFEGTDKVVRIKVSAEDTLSNVLYFMSTGCHLYIQTTTPELVDVLLEDLKTPIIQNRYVTIFSKQA